MRDDTTKETKTMNAQTREMNREQKLEQAVRLILCADDMRVAGNAYRNSETVALVPASREQLIDALGETGTYVPQPGSPPRAWPASGDGREPWQCSEYTRNTCHCGEEILAMHFFDESVWYHTTTNDDDCATVDRPSAR